LLRVPREAPIRTSVGLDEALQSADGVGLEPSGIGAAAGRRRLVQASAVKPYSAAKRTFVGVAATHPDRDSWLLNGSRQAGCLAHGVVFADEPEWLPAPQADQDIKSLV
jgi:hypothetical protein